jgi:hypothetical protein
MTSSDFMSPEYPQLNDELSEHLDGCETCQAGVKAKPVAIAAKPQLCSKWFAIIQKWADKEGAINNIVAHDEYGNEAG